MPINLDELDKPIDDAAREALNKAVQEVIYKTPGKIPKDKGKTTPPKYSLRTALKNRADDVSSKLLMESDDTLTRLQGLLPGDYFVAHAALAASIRSMVCREYTRYAKQERRRHHKEHTLHPNAPQADKNVHTRALSKLNSDIQAYNRENRFETTKFSYGREDYIKVKRFNPMNDTSSTQQTYSKNPKPTYVAQPPAPAPTFTPQAPIEQTVEDVAELEDFDVWFSKKPKIRRAFTTGERDPYKFYTPEGWEMTADERQAQMARNRIPDDEWADQIEEEY